MTAPAFPDEAADRVVADDLAAAAFTLARRFAAGATMWCLAPRWPAHGSHVAVEFVHPVIVGKRALPAVHVEGPDLVGTVRLLSRPGDVLLAVGPGDDPDIVEAMRRAEAWALTRVWLGAGNRPPADYLDHRAWWDDVDADEAARSGDVVILYHLLWELTHVVFEHPGLLAAEPAGDDQVCITCSDEGRVAEVRSLDEVGGAQAVVGGRLEVIDLGLLEAVGPGDLVLVHAGVALTVLHRAGRSGWAGRADQAGWAGVPS